MSLAHTMSDGAASMPFERPAEDNGLFVLRFDAVLNTTGDGITLTFEDNVVSLEGLSVGVAAKFFDALHRPAAIAEICQKSGLSRPTVLGLIDALVRAGAAGRDDADELLSPRDLVEICHGLFPAWKTRLFGHSLWRALAEGRASQETFLGWLAESYHFIEGVTLRIPAVIAATSERAVRRHFVKHFSEEYDHHHFFAVALTRAGVPLGAVRDAGPLPGTRAVLNWMRDCGRRDPLMYAACSGFLEATGADRSGARLFYAELSRHYDPSVVAPLAQHAALDERYEHGGFVEKIAGEIGSVSRARADRALAAVHGLVETLELWSSDIERHYCEASQIAVGSVRRYRAYSKG